MFETEEYLAVDTEENSHYQNNYEENGCIGCGNLMVEEGYKAKLCTECREKLYKRKLPIVIKFAVVIILSIMLFSLVKLPKYLEQGILLKRAEKSLKSNNYFTAMKNYEKLIEIYPDNKKLLVDLAEVYYQNNYISEIYEIYKSLEKVKMESSLVERMDRIINRINRYYYLNDTIYNQLENTGERDLKVWINIIEEYLKSEPEDISAKYYLAYYYYEENRFMEAESQLEELLSKYGGVYLAEDLLCDVYFSQKKYDEGLELTEKVFKRNSESIMAKIQVGKIRLKQKNNLDAYKIAEEAYNLDNKNLKATLFLALASHYNGLEKERDDLFNTCLEYEYLDEEEIKYYEDIFSGAIDWQE